MNKDIQAFIYGSSLLSVAASLILFLRGKRDAAIFAGLWAPTMLAWGAYWNSEGGRPEQPAGE